MTHRSSTVQFAIALSCSASIAGGQPQIELVERLQCSPCRLEFSSITTLGEKGAGTIESEFARVARDARGRYYVYQLGATSIKVFEPSGRYLKTFGRSGEGPGEFRDLGNIVRRGDTLRVFDRSLLRENLFGPDLQFLGSVKWEVPPKFTSSATLDDGTLVVSQKINSPSRIGLPLHSVARDGRILRSFGSVNGAYRPDIPDLANRVVTAAGRFEIWSAHRAAYLIDLVDARTGRIEKQLVRRVSWFPDGERPAARPNASEPPRPRLASIHRDSSGLLWVLLSVADARWRSAVTGENPDHPAVTDPLKYWDDIIEVIDPAKGMVLASMRFDEAPGWFVEGNLFQRVVPAADGSPMIKIDQVTLKGR